MYRYRGTPLDWHARLAGATLACPPAGVASHRSAAALLGIERVAERVALEVSVVGPALPLLGEVTVHRTRRLDPCDITTVAGIRTTTGARTLVDLAARLDRSALTAALDDAICALVVGRSWMHRRATALRSGRAGVGILVGLTAPGAEGGFRSWLERRSAASFRAGGLPRPCWNAPIRHGGRLIGVVDVLWPRPRLVVELDGLRFHSTPAQRQRDAEKANELQIARYGLLRYTWLDIVQRPDEVVAQIREALENARPTAGVAA